MAAPAAAEGPPKKLFRTYPPLDLLDMMLRACGLQGHGDLRWFAASELVLETQEEWLPLLEPYYLPCKARRFFGGRGDLDGARVITLFRHCLACHGYHLAVQERMYRDVKQCLYQIQPDRSFKDLSGVSLTVEFL